YRMGREWIECVGSPCVGQCFFRLPGCRRETRKRSQHPRLTRAQPVCSFVLLQRAGWNTLYAEVVHAPGMVHRGVVRIESQRSFRRRSRLLRESRQGGGVGVQLYRAYRDSDPRSREVRVECHGLPEVSQRLTQRYRRCIRPCAPCCFPAKERIVGNRIARGRLRQLDFFGGGKRKSECPCNSCSNVALDLEYVCEWRIARLAPAHLRSVICCLHQFRTHLYPTGPVRLPGPSHGAREQVAHAKLARDLLGRKSSSAVLAGAQARDHLDVGNARELSAY